MTFLAIFKRVTPFILTFAAGLFIASFFVTIATPNFSGFRRNPSKYREFKKMKWDVEALRREKIQLENEIENLKSVKREVMVEESVAPIDGLDLNAVPPPPPPPVRLKEMKMKMKTVEIR